MFLFFQRFYSKMGKVGTGLILLNFWKWKLHLRIQFQSRDLSSWKKKWKQTQSQIKLIAFSWMYSNWRARRINLSFCLANFPTQLFRFFHVPLISFSHHHHHLIAVKIITHCSTTGSSTTWLNYSKTRPMSC